MKINYYSKRSRDKIILRTAKAIKQLKTDLTRPSGLNISEYSTVLK